MLVTWESHITSLGTLQKATLVPSNAHKGPFTVYFTFQGLIAHYFSYVYLLQYGCCSNEGRILLFHTAQCDFCTYRRFGTHCDW
jgi:hypothetical protein